MSRKTKIWLITAGSLILVGCVLFVGVMSVLKWDFAKLSTVKYETNTYETEETFSDISIKTDTADIVFALSDDGKCRVECFEEENAKHSVNVENGALVIKRSESKSRYDYIGLYFGSPKITVYLPKTEYNALIIKESTGNIKLPQNFSFASADVSLSTGDVDFLAPVSGNVKIKTSTGDILVKSASVGSLDLSVTTGKVTVSGVTGTGDVAVVVSTGKTYLADISCKSVISNGDTGSITLSNVVAAETFSLERSTGDVKFNDCDAADIYVKTDTGDVTGTLLSDKVYIIDTDTGSVDVPKTSTGGRCEIKTDTGDVKIKVK